MAGIDNAEMNQKAVFRQIVTKNPNSNKSLRQLAARSFSDAAVGPDKKEFKMKKFLMILAVTTMAVSPVLTSQAKAASRTTVTKKVDVKNGRKTVAKRLVTENSKSNRHNYRASSNSRAKIAVSKVRWSKGQRFNSHIATNYRVINNPRSYRLKNAPRGYLWVESGNDAILVGIASGVVSAVIANALLG